MRRLAVRALNDLSSMLAGGLRTPCKRRKRRGQRRAKGRAAQGKRPGPAGTIRALRSRGHGGTRGRPQGRSPWAEPRPLRSAQPVSHMSHRPPSPTPLGCEWHGPDALVRKEGAGEPLSGGGGTRQPPAGNTPSPGSCGGGERT